jgi:hypothetical protein
MSIKEMMDELIRKEEQRLGVNSPEFIQRHIEIMEETNRLLQQDLMMEQETM